MCECLYIVDKLYLFIGIILDCVIICIKKPNRGLRVLSGNVIVETLNRQSCLSFFS